MELKGNLVMMYIFWKWWIRNYSLQRRKRKPLSPRQCPRLIFRKRRNSLLKILKEISHRSLASVLLNLKRITISWRAILNLVKIMLIKWKSVHHLLSYHLLLLNLHSSISLLHINHLQMQGLQTSRKLVTKIHSLK